MTEATQTLTVATLEQVLDQTYQALAERMTKLADPLPETPDEGGWTVRQLLSHFAGAWYRIPIHAGFYFGGSNVPIVPHDPYWISEWESAPLRSFQLAMLAGYHGSKALLATLTDSDLERALPTPFGEMNLGQVLMLSFDGHIEKFHGAQLEAFASV